MRTGLLIPTIGLASALAAPRAAAGQDQFILYVTECTLGTQQIFNAVGEGADPASIVNFTRERACAAGDSEHNVVKVRGQKALMTMEQGKMSVDFGNPENPTFTMYNAGNNTHATWTAKELEELMNQMMGGARGGGGGARGALADAMRQARAAMGGGEEQKVEGLYAVSSLTDCDGQAYGAHQGEVGLDGGNPMQKNWILRGCVTNRHPNALRTFRAMQKATSQFANMGQEKDPIDQKEDELADKGLPIDVRKLTQGGGFTAGLNYVLDFFRLEEASVSASDVNAEEGTKVTLQQFMTSMMGGPGM